jgi:hypothetical protein
LLAPVDVVEVFEPPPHPSAAAAARTASAATAERPAGMG